MVQVRALATVLVLSGMISLVYLHDSRVASEHKQDLKVERAALSATKAELEDLRTQHAVTTQKLTNSEQLLKAAEGRTQDLNSELRILRASLANVTSTEHAVQGELQLAQTALAGLRDELRKSSSSLGSCQKGAAEQTLKYEEKSKKATLEYATCAKLLATSQDTTSKLREAMKRLRSEHEKVKDSTGSDDLGSVKKVLTVVPKTVKNQQHPAADGTETESPQEVPTRLLKRSRKGTFESGDNPTNSTTPPLATPTDPSGKKDGMRGSLDDESADVAVVENADGHPQGGHADQAEAQEVQEVQEDAG